MSNLGLLIEISSPNASPNTVAINTPSTLGTPGFKKPDIIKPGFKKPLFAQNLKLNLSTPISSPISSPIFNPITSSNFSPLNIQLKNDCQGDEQEKEHYIKTKEIFFNKIANVKNKCKTFNSEDIKNITKNSIVYKDKDSKKIIKKSNIYSNTQKYLDENAINCIVASTRIKFAMDENINNITYSELQKYFPEHFLQIIPFENGECIDEQLSKSEKKTIISNFLKMDLIEGKSLTNYINEIINKYDTNQDISQDDINLCNILLQLVYVLIYANMKGYYHNDFKFDNIMIYSNSTGPERKIYDKIPGIKMKLTRSMFFKLIDYSNSLKLPSNSDDQINIIDLNQLMILLNNFLNYENLSNNKIKDALPLVNNLFEIISNILFNKNSIYGNIYRSDMLRLLNENSIKEYSIKMNLNDIKLLFREIFNKFLRYTNIKILANKYLKYKIKYLELKRNMSL